MKKTIRLTESDLVRIVKRVIRENEEQQIANDVRDLILNNISKKDLITLGSLYNDLGEDEFKDVAEDVIEDKMVNETIHISRQGIEVDTEDEKNKLEAKLIINKIFSVIAAPTVASWSYMLANSGHVTQSIVAGVIAAAIAGSNLLSKLPLDVRVEPLPEKLKGSRMDKFVSSEMSKFDLRKKTIRDILKHFELKGIPEKAVRPFIKHWAETNGVTIKKR